MHFQAESDDKRNKKLSTSGQLLLDLTPELRMYKM